MDSIQLARQVLQADGNPFSTLSLAPGLSGVSVNTAIGDARRNYMRLASFIHPDKLKNSFDKATEAFQCLVHAFESFADPTQRKAIWIKDAKATRASAPAACETSKRMEAAAKPQPVQSAVKKKKKGKETALSVNPVEKPLPARRKQRRKVSKPKEAKDDFISSDEDEDEGSEEVESEVSSSSAAGEGLVAEPAVSTSRTPIGQPRTGPTFLQTTIRCPQCRTPWEPDSKPQYSLFMGSWANKVHCQLCLFSFGSATALHGCPYCQAPFDYDASMYDSVINCHRCKKPFGFPYYPVNQMLIDQVNLNAWREQRARETANDREARAQARAGRRGTDVGAGRLAMLVGSCIMDEECPLCHKRVVRSHAAHVNACRQNFPDEKRKSRKAMTASCNTSVKAKSSPRKPMQAKTTGKGASVPRVKPAKPVKKGSVTTRKRRRSSDSRELSPGSESSFSGSDDDDE